MKTKNAQLSLTNQPFSSTTWLNILYTRNKLTALFHDILKRYDLSAEQFSVLKLLRTPQEQPVALYAIQEKMITEASNVSRLVAKLLLKGLVIRDVCSDNRRKVAISITLGGLKLLQELEPQIIACEETLAKNLSMQELDNLNFLLAKYRTIAI